MSDERPCTPDRRNNGRRRRQRGFTLLEIIIALSILAMALGALIGHEGVAIQMSDYSNKVSQATFLAQGKLLDVEHKLITDGMEEYDGCRDGDFRSEGFREFRWKACGYEIEMEEGAEEMLLGQLQALIGGGASVDSAESAGDDALGGLLAKVAMGVGMIPAVIQALGENLRKVTVEVTWEDQVGERRVELTRLVSALGADVGNQPVPVGPGAVPGGAAGGIGLPGGSGGSR